MTLTQLAPSLACPACGLIEFRGSDRWQCKPPCLASFSVVGGTTIRVVDFNPSTKTTRGWTLYHVESGAFWHPDPSGSLSKR